MENGLDNYFSDMISKPQVTMKKGGKTALS